MKIVIYIECITFIETDIRVIGARNKPLFRPLINFNIENWKDLHQITIGRHVFSGERYHVFTIFKNL